MEIDFAKEMKKKRLFIDFESRSPLDLNGKNSVGLYNYMNCLQTEMLMCAYGYGDSSLEPLDVKMWHIWTGEPMPQDLRGWLADPEVDIVAFNSSFERHGLRKHGAYLETERFEDPQPSARMLSLPADLDAVSDILGLDRDLGKDKRGKQLINLFSSPVIKKAKKPTKKNPAGEPGRVYYNDWNSHPKEWDEFCEYCFTPDHTLLGTDLRWRPASEFRIGDEVLGFDELGPRRRFRKAKIEKISYEDAPIFECTLGSGKLFRVTGDHQWLVCHAGHDSNQKLHWVKTVDLFSRGNPHQGGRGTHRVPLLLKPWTEDQSKDAGWLAGLFDGEGSLSKNVLSFGQNRGEVLNRATHLLKKYAEISISGESNCKKVWIKGGKYQTLEVLGKLRPERLIEKVNFDQLGQLECRDIRDEVISIIKKGIQRIIKIQTSTGTLVVDGYPMHNCKQDVRAEREIARREILLRVFPLPSFERAIWLFDQKVNDRGVHVDRQFVTNGLALGIRAKEETKAEMNKITGLLNSNSRDQLLPWVTERGYEDDSLEKDAVKTALKFNTKLTPECRKILEMRLNASSTTYTKLAAVLRQLCSDDRLRGQFIYMGSARCGRWSGNAVQMHNMARPIPAFEDEAIVDEARNLIFALNYDGIIDRWPIWTQTVKPAKRDYGSVLATIKNTIRTIFTAEEGKRLNVCDLNAIETRKAAYLCQCKPLNDVFIPRLGKPNGNDPYIDFAASMNGMTYEQLEANYHSLDKAIKAIAKKMRQDMKPAVLGCVYRLKGGSVETDWKTGRPVLTGLLDYASKMGITLDEKTANEAVRFFRQRYQEIKQGWYDLEQLVADVLAEGAVRVKREWGPGGIVKFDKLIVNDHGARRNILRIQLPSGRYLHYINARLEKTEMPWKDRDGNDVFKMVLVYDGQNQTTHQWEHHTTSHGGKILENIVQASSRDILALKLLLFEKARLFVVGHVHDEGITETEDDPLAPGLFEMDSLMRAPVTFLPGFLLGCDGFQGRYYHK